MYYYKSRFLNKSYCTQIPYLVMIPIHHSTRQSKVQGRTISDHLQSSGVEFPPTAACLATHSTIAEANKASNYAGASLVTEATAFWQGTTYREGGLHQSLFQLLTVDFFIVCKLVCFAGALTVTFLADLQTHHLVP